MSDPVAFAVAVSVHWFAAMSGGVALGIGIVEYFRRRSFAPIIWVLIGIICLFFACYQTWLDKKIEAAAMQCKILKFERRSEAKNGLSSLIDKADPLLNANLTRNGPPDEYENWKVNVNQWATNVRMWVAMNLGNAAVTKAMDTANIPATFWHQGISDEHNYALSSIARVKQNLEQLMESSAWDDFDMRTAASIVTCSER